MCSGGGEEALNNAIKFLRYFTRSFSSRTTLSYRTYMDRINTCRLQHFCFHFCIASHHFLRCVCESTNLLVFFTHISFKKFPFLYPSARIFWEFNQCKNADLTVFVQDGQTTSFAHDSHSCRFLMMRTHFSLRCGFIKFIYRTESFSSPQFLKTSSGSLQLDFTLLNFTLFTVVVLLHLQRPEAVRFTIYTHEVRLKSLMSKYSLSRSRWRSLGNYLSLFYY